ncbi:Clavaminate synthase-like protein [Gonapodya prolifera JEL478]|uniref:Clavaminate synthase-like protein n=1 Tax=Gonapodya prolifera (strain JEL478) TaxID=1344416 RepID=A0A139A7Y2_GONPJ|nr:Clavaminate synthase-like protein [Gonapodya prolifera JEL478]|eukprot:KXS12906.1 Clavaminate synthase-like protein [Gonapodya prolifera JEL478]
MLVTATLSDSDHSKLTATEKLSQDQVGPEDESAAVAKFSKSFKVIPILDLALLRGSPAEKASFLEQFRDVMMTCGFLYIKNTGVSDDLQKRIYDVVVKTFALPREEKVKFAIEKSPVFKGWNELGKEVTYGKNDMRELVGIGYDNRLRLPSEPLWFNNLGPWNVPTDEQVPNFRATVTEYLAAMHNLALELLHAVAATLGLAPTYFDELWLNDETGREASHFQFNHYPSIDTESNPEWAENLGDAAHQDDDIVTILAQDMVGGLQVQNFDGDWIDVKPIEGTMVCNLGSFLEAVTGGRYIATSHRVRLNTSGKSRYSWPYFLQPKITTARWVEPLPDEMLPEEVRNYKPDVKNRYEAMEFNRKIAKTIGEYMFYVKQMKSYPEAKEIHYPDVDWVKELNIDPVLAKRFL